MTRTPDGRIWIDLTDHEIRMAYWFYVPNMYLKNLHSLPLTCADGAPTEWAGIAEGWPQWRNLELYVRQAWRHSDRGGDVLLDPYCFSVNIDPSVKQAREQAKLPPLPNYAGTWNPSETMPPSACRARLIVQKWRRARIQSLSAHDMFDHGIWRGDVATEPGQYRQGYRREAFAGATRSTAVEAFADAWDARHGSGAWASNPEVLTFSFKVKSMFYVFQAARPSEAP